ncbi:MAG: hypothetical protein DRN37_04100 [Thermoplasmata archaeon]|nr:MAG: hypothetical protein DRN37_04100 [Thermoplasmata archaeon]
MAGKRLQASGIVALLVMVSILSGCLGTGNGGWFTGDRDGDGIPDKDDAFPRDPSEWEDSDGDGWGDNSDPYPQDYDNDGFTDATDIKKNGDAAIKISLTRFDVMDKVDYVLPRADVFFDIYINNRLETRIDDDGHPWRATIAQLYTINSIFVYNIDDDQQYTNITIVMWDADWPLRNDMIDIDGHDGTKELHIVFDALTGTWTGDDTDGHADGRDDGVRSAGDDDGVLWYDIELIDVTYYKTYSWTFGFKSFSLSVNIPRESYAYYSHLKVDRSPESSSEIALFVTPDDEVVMEVADTLHSLAQEHGYDYDKTADFVLRFVQSLEYTYDNYTTPANEYWRFSVETLVDETGDCEDTSILYASLMEALGYDAVLVLLPGHAAVGIAGTDHAGYYYTYNGVNYYYCETTGSGWNMGEIPDEYKEESATIVQVG